MQYQKTTCTEWVLSETKKTVDNKWVKIFERFKVVQTMYSSGRDLCRPFYANWWCE